VNKNNKIIIALLLCIGTQTTQTMGIIGTGLLKEINTSTPLEIKAGLGLAAASSGAYYLYKHPEVRKQITDSWIWKSKTALTAAAATVALSNFLPSIAGFKSITLLSSLESSVPSVFPLCLQAKQAPFFALGAWIASEGYDWLIDRYTANHISLKRKKWENDLYTIILNNGNNLTDLKKWIDVRHTAVNNEGSDFKQLKKDISAKVVNLFLPEEDMPALLIPCFINLRLKEREKVIQDLEKSTGLIAYLVARVNGDQYSLSSLSNICMRKTGDIYNFETSAQHVLEYYKDGSDLSRYMHIHSFPRLEGFSWNKKVNLQWELIKEYMFLYLVKDLYELPASS
jgi:hypothetical protein